MADDLRLLCVFAHPDDETLGTGSTIAKYAAEGVGVYLVTATRGQRGWPGDERENPGLEALGRLRGDELRAAARVLGIRDVALLDYVDGDLDQADPAEAIGRIAAELRRVRPQVVITFGPDGAYGHPDHIAISQFTGAACVLAADAGFAVPGPDSLAPHRVSKLYFMVDTSADAAAYQSVVGEIIMPVDGVERRVVTWPDWAISARIDGGEHVPTVLRAVACHASQIVGFPDLATLSAAQQQALAGVRSYYRAFSLVNGGHRVESDLFEGVR